MKFLIIPLSITLVLSSGTASACTLKEAQTKLTEFNIMMQVYNRKMAKFVERGEDSPASLEKKRLEMAESSAAIGILLSKETEAKPNIQFSDKVSSDICNGYDALMKQHAPKGYKSAPILREETTNNPSCTSQSMWKRYGVAIQKQRALAVAGKITKKENGSYMILNTRIGEYSQTNLAKACTLVGEFEQRLAAE